MSGPDGWWMQELRDGIQLSMWSVVGRRRNDMRGIEAPQGIDRKAALALQNRPLPAEGVGLLCSLLARSI